jgi:colanic acid/amylovoran biosynthesis protein
MPSINFPASTQRASSWLHAHVPLGRRQLGPAAGLATLILTPDPWNVAGSFGDEAMLRSTMQALHPATDGRGIGVVAYGDIAVANARRLGLEPVPLGLWSQREMARGLRSLRPARVIVVGADCMDGHYSLEVTQRMGTFAALAARMGAHTTVIGFSFNATPDDSLRSLFASWPNRLRVCIRDAVSLERFQRFCGRHAELVADSAFLLKPEPTSAAAVNATRWAQAQRADGRVVLGLNLHPMLYANADARSVDALVESCLAAIGTAAQERRLAVCLIPHDLRGSFSDNNVLSRLTGPLAGLLGESAVHHLEGDLDAPTLKATTAALDCLLVARMHLAIAALGMGIPIAAVTYQGKFEGLFDHFKLPHDLMLDPVQAQDPKRLAAVLARLLDQRAELRQAIEARLPVVRELSARNFNET